MFGGLLIVVCGGLRGTHDWKDSSIGFRELSKFVLHVYRKIIVLSLRTCKSHSAAPFSERLKKTNTKGQANATKNVYGGCEQHWKGC